MSGPKPNAVRDAERFTDKFTPEPNSGCWLWTAAIAPNNRGFIYGVFWLRGRQIKAHRAAWILTHGDIPEGIHVCHRCDVPLCVNPDHLFLGTHFDNMRDMSAKGRHVSVVKPLALDRILEQVKKIRVGGDDAAAVADSASRAG